MMAINRKLFKMFLDLRQKNSEEKTQEMPRLRDQCDRDGGKILGDNVSGILTMKLGFLDMAGMPHTLIYSSCNYAQKLTKNEVRQNSSMNVGGAKRSHPQPKSCRQLTATSRSQFSLEMWS